MTKKPVKPYTVDGKPKTPDDLRRLHDYLVDIETISVISDEMRRVVENEWPEFIHKVQRIAGDEVKRRHFNSAAHDQSHYYGSDQAKPVARAAFFATRLRPAPVFRTALFADFIAFAVLDFLRFAIFVPPVSRFVQLGSYLHLRQARF